MKISEVQDLLYDLKDMEGNVEVQGISVIENRAIISYKNSDSNDKTYKAEYENCDIS